MDYKKKINFNIIGFIILTIIMLICLTGCGSVKDSKQIKKYIKDNYNIDVEIVAIQESKEQNEYTLKEKNRDIVFKCTSSMKPMMIDGTKLGSFEQTTDDYYSSLTKSIESELQAISKKYNVEFEESYYGLIWLMKIKDDKIDFNKTLNIANELMKAYDLKKEPSTNETDSIFVQLNNDITDHYYKYTIKGKKTDLGNSYDDFMKEWDIPEQLESDVLEYVNNLYSGESYILDVTIIPDYTEDYNQKCISYLIKNNTAKIKSEFRINLNMYREDLKNNKLKNMETYIQGEIKYVYE